MAEVLLLLGGNVGEVRELQQQATGLLIERIGPLLAKSRRHWTEAWGFVDERLFLNQALLFHTALAPEAVLAIALEVEQQLGRTRSSGPRYAARTIDIDLLFMDDRVVGTERLVLPHPRMHERAFALSPTADVAPGWMHPLLGRTALKLLDDVLSKA